MIDQNRTGPSQHNKLADTLRKTHKQKYGRGCSREKNEKKTTPIAYHDRYKKKKRKKTTQLTRPFALEAKNLTTSYLHDAAAWWSGVHPSASSAITSSGRGSSIETNEVLPLMAARCSSVLKRSCLKIMAHDGHARMRRIRMKANINLTVKCDRYNRRVACDILRTSDG